MSRILVSLLAILSSGLSFAQTAPTLVGSGYGLPGYLTIAPGQILTLQVAGLKAILSSPVKADKAPLPASLAGISVTVDQYGIYGAGDISLAARLLAVSQ